jgi:hypothetical protein
MSWGAEPQFLSYRAAVPLDAGVERAVAHHAPVDEQTAGRGEPIADVKRQQASLAGTLICALSLGSHRT